jgi:hypothetical protein
MEANLKPIHKKSLSSAFSKSKGVWFLSAVLNLIFFSMRLFSLFLTQKVFRSRLTPVSHWLLIGMVKADNTRESCICNDDAAPGQGLPWAILKKGSPQKPVFFLSL